MSKFFETGKFEEKYLIGNKRNCNYAGVEKVVVHEFDDIAILKLAEPLKVNHKKELNYQVLQQPLQPLSGTFVYFKVGQNPILKLSWH